MGAMLTYGNRKFENLDSQMRKLIPPLHKISRDLLPKLNADSMAFSNFMVRNRLKTWVHISVRQAPVMNMRKHQA